MPDDHSHTALEGTPLDREPAIPLTRGTVLAGRYEIQQTLGRGGMGVVVRAFDRVVGEEVAIKILRSEYAHDRRWVDRLAREVRLARTIQHPNVCRVFDFGSADGHHFITMELATGGTLRDVIVGAASRSSEDRVADALSVIRGLAAIHAAGIIHRDVTPQNVLRMADGRLVVSDFGLAAVATGPTTSVHGGTVAYMAPEIMTGAPADFTADVWGLGLVVWEVLTGSREGITSPRQTGGRSGEGPVHSAEERRLRRLARTCCVRNPRMRPGTAGEVLQLFMGRRNLPTRRRVRRWIGFASGVLLLAAGIAVYRATTRGDVSSKSSKMDTLVVQNDPDWLKDSRTLATFPSRIECLLALPGERTVRAIVDDPRRAYDIDLPTGRRQDSPLVPAAIAEGCARLSPDGSKLIFQGRDSAGRPHIMLSRHPDGSSAVPLIGSVEPVLTSEPQWIDNETLVFEADPEHAAVFSLSTGRMTIVPGLPEDDALRYGFTKAGAKGEVLVGYHDSIGTTVRIISWPSLKVASQFRLDAHSMEWGIESDMFVGAAAPKGRFVGLITIDRATNAARTVSKPGTNLRHPVRIADNLLFTETTFSDEVWVRDSSGTEKKVGVKGVPLTLAGSILGDVLVSAADDEGSASISWYDADGRYKGRVTDGPRDWLPAFFPSGKEWVYAEGDRRILRCVIGKTECRPIPITGASPQIMAGLMVSPDELKVALVALARTGPVAAWIPIAGGSVHKVAESEGMCAPQWSSPRHLWVSRRSDAAHVWIEVDVETQQPTGRRHQGISDCTKGGVDPGAPVSPIARAKPRTTSEVRRASIR